MKKIIILTLSLALFITLSSCKKNVKVIEKTYDFKIQAAIGSVKIESKGTNRIPVIDEMVKTGETIITGKNSIADLLYGKRGLIRINENSKVTVSELNEKIGGNTQIDIEKGKLFITISKLSSKTRFKVKTPTTIASIRGTTFRIIAEINATRLDVISGKVAVKPAFKNKIIEDVKWEVATEETINISSKTVKEIASKTEKAEEIETQKIAPEKMNEIKKEVKSIKAETLAKLHSSTRTEFKIKTLKMKKEDVAKEEKTIEAFEFKKENAPSKKREENGTIDDDKRNVEIDTEKRKQLLAEKARLKAAEEKKRKEAEKLAAEKAAKEKAEQEAIRRKKEEEKRLDKINMPVPL